MFITSSFPFKFASYKKTIVSPKNRTTLLTSFSVSHYPHMVMVGAMFGDHLTLCKKTPSGHLIVEDTCVEAENKEMSLENLVANFKSSDGLDFIIIRIPVYFLITRQKDRRIKMYMTTIKDYVKVFAAPEEFFGSYPEENRYYSAPFTVEVLLNDPRKSEEANPNEEVVDFEEPVTESVFENLVQADKAIRRIRIGWLKEGKIVFLNFPLEKTSNNDLHKIVAEMEKSPFEFFEILGNTRIAGIRRKKNIEWYAEIQDSEKDDEYLYIKEVNGIFKMFVSEDESEKCKDESKDESKKCKDESKVVFKDESKVVFKDKSEKDISKDESEKDVSKDESKVVFKDVSEKSENERNDPGK